MKEKTNRILKMIFNMILMIALVSAFTGVQRAEAAEAAKAQVSVNGAVDNVLRTHTLHWDKNWGRLSCTTDTWELEVKNDSGSEKRISIQYLIEGDFTSQVSPNLDGGRGARLENTYLWKDSISFTLQAGETRKIPVKMSYSHKGADYHAEAHLSAKNVFPVSHDFFKPLPIKAGETKEGTGSTARVDYYSFTLAQDSAVRFNAESASIATYKASRPEEGKVETSPDNENMIQYLPKGNYVLEVFAGYDVSKEYSVEFDVEAFGFGTVEIGWQDGNNIGKVQQDKAFTINYKPGTNFGTPNGSMLEMVNGDVVMGTSTSYKGSCYVNEPGYYSIPVEIVYSKWNITLRKKINFEYVARPAAPAQYNLIRGSHKSFTFGSSFAARNGDEIYLQRYAGGGKWVNAAKYDNSYGTKQKYFTASGLKGNTTYTFRMIGVVPAANGKPALYSDPSGSFKLRTASAVKPVIKSVKISKLKTRKVPKKWVGGHWNSNHDWVSGHYEKGYKYLSFNVKVTLKKKVPGAVYLSTQDGYTPVAKYAKSKGGKVFNYSFRATYKKKGKYIPIRVRTTTKIKSIVGPMSKTKKVKVR